MMRKAKKLPEIIKRTFEIPIEHQIATALVTLENIIYEYLKEDDTALGPHEKEFVFFYKKLYNITTEKQKLVTGKFIKEATENEFVRKIKEETKNPLKNFGFNTNSIREKKDFDVLKSISAIIDFLNENGVSELNEEKEKIIEIYKEELNINGRVQNSV